jgi:hypothetical protein
MASPVPCPLDPRASAKAYVTNQMPRHEMRDFEEHLANCERCAEIVEEAKAPQPVSVVHQTEDGPVHLWASPDQEGGWKAQIWGQQLAGARRFQTLPEANRYLLDSFARMFPEHECKGGCQHLDEAAQATAAARMQFWDYWE